MLRIGWFDEISDDIILFVAKLTNIYYVMIYFIYFLNFSKEDKEN